MPPSQPIESIELTARGLRFPALSCGRGPLVLCMHGFPDTRFSYRQLLPAFAEAGFRAVAPALRGYAAGCIPPARESHALEAARDVLALIEALGERTAHLVGHDWGAIVAYLSAALSPASFRSVTTLAVPHPLEMVKLLKRYPRQLVMSRYMLFFQAPGLAERAVRLRDFAYLEGLWRAWSPRYEDRRYDLGELKRAFRVDGVLEASLGYYRAMFALHRRENAEARALLEARLDVPMLALSGLEDGCIDAHVFREAMQSAPYSRLTITQLAQLGHFLHLEDPRVVLGHILPFIARHSS